MEAVHRAASDEDIDRLEVVIAVTVKLSFMDADTARVQQTLAELLLHHALKTGKAKNLEKAGRDAVARGATNTAVRAAVLKAVNQAASTGKINMLSALLAVAVKWGAVDADIAQAQQTVSELLLRDALDTGHADQIEKAGRVAVARGATNASVRTVVLEAVNRAASTGSINMLEALLAVAVEWGSEDADIARANKHSLSYVCAMHWTLSAQIKFKRLYKKLLLVELPMHLSGLL